VVKINGKVADAQKIARTCPKEIFTAKGEKLDVVKDNVYECHLCQQCVDLEKNISLEESGNFIFTLESWGQLSCKETLTQSVEILLEKIEDLEKQI
jgi:NAD-dependent dihydropyrimidine dehydrogenase PreA subunit